MIDVWNTVSDFIRPPRMFLSTEIIIKKRIVYVSRGLLYIEFIYQFLFLNDSV